MHWYERFGLENNPFSTDPFEGKYTMVNYADLVEELVYQVAKGSIIGLTGKPGSGKTTMLVQLIQQFGGKGRVLYVDGKVFQKSFDIESELDEKGRSLLRKVSRKKPKKLIVLLDNADALSSVNMQKLKYYFDRDYVQSVVFTGSSMQEMNIPASILDRIGEHTFTIPDMINYDALRVVRERFADHFFLPDAIILKLFDQSEHNVKQLLVNCEKVCKYVVAQGKGEVLPKYVRIALKKKAKKTTKVTNHASSKQKAST